MKLTVQIDYITSFVNLPTVTKFLSNKIKNQVYKNSTVSWMQPRIHDFFIIRSVEFMQIFLLIVIFILIVINLKQADELRNLERKTLDAFKVICKKLKQNMEDK